MSEIKKRYREVLVGFEKFSFSDEQLMASKHDLDLALQDLEICKQCKGGNCRTTANTKNYIPPGSNKEFTYYGGSPYYFALHEYDCRFYQQPCFRLFECPGWDQRKVDIEKRFLSEMQY